MKRFLPLMLVLSLLLSLAACGGTPAQTDKTADNTDTNPTTSDSTSPAGPSEPADDDAPAAAGPLFSEPQTFTAWMSGSVLFDPNITDFNDTPAWQKVQEMTNVTIQWELVSQAAATEQFNLMMVAGNYPELINGGSFSTNGYQYYLDEDILVDLAPYITGGSAPHYQALRDADDDVRRDTMLDSGAMTTFYRILTSIQQSWKGPYAQLAPAQAAGIDVDSLETVDDYHDLLVVYRDAGLERPYHLDPTGFDGPLLAAYNLGGAGYTSPFITVDGKIQYSYIMDEYYDYLVTAHSWYDEGLIEPEFYGTVGDVAWDMELMASGSYGITFAASTVAQMLTDISGKEYRAILSPVLHSGGTRKVAQIVGTTARVETAVTSVTTACHDVEAAVKYLDYFYSDDMFYLANYGIEGETFTLDADGQPQYTNLFLDDTEHNWTAKSQYYALWGSAGFLYAWDAQKVGMPDSVLYAYGLWDQNYEDERTLPALSMTASEMETYSSRYSDIDTYVKESAVKFISGMQPLTPESYADYVEHIKSMNIDDCIGVYQAAYDRYLTR